MCGLQESTIFSVLSLPSKDQVWDSIGLVESANVHCRGDPWVPVPHSLLAQLMIHHLDSLDCWAADSTPKPVEAFFSVCNSSQWPEKCLLVGSYPRPAPQYLLGSWEPMGPRQVVTDYNVHFYRVVISPAMVQKLRLHWL